MLRTRRLLLLAPFIVRASASSRLVADGRYARLFDGSGKPVTSLLMGEPSSGQPFVASIPVEPRPDLLASNFQAAWKAQAREVAERFRNNAQLVGYGWRPLDWSAKLVRSLRESSSLPETRAVYLLWLKDRYSYVIDRLNEVYGTSASSFTELETIRWPKAFSPTIEADNLAFLPGVARTLYTTASEAIRAVHPEGVILGERFPASTPAPVLEAVGPSIDAYWLDFEPPISLKLPKPILRLG
jgi:hypothetical protein